MILSKGNIAPGFDLYATPDQTLSLSEIKDKRVILAFYPADWSPVCGDQSYLSPDSINPGADGILNALEELSHINI